jgi:hypothetical protein
MLDQNTQSYKHFLGRDIVTDNDPNAPFKTVPKDRKDYKIYRQYYENLMQEVCGDDAIIKLTIACEGKDEKLRPVKMRKQKPEHYGCSFVFACHHCIHQDPVNPEGISYKLDMNSVCGKCALCLLDSVQSILKVKPDRFRDRRQANK